MQLGPLVRRRLGVAAWVLLLAVVAWAHLWRLAEVPRGLYLDESSVGWNAALIVERGEDEHGVGWPIFFRAFGEYKNPLHVYLTALIFALGGVSVTALRATSALFFAGFLAALAGLVRSLFPGSRPTVLWAVAAAGFLPWFFAISRLAFEVVSQLTVVAVALWLLRATYREAGGRPWLALAAGAALGLSTYAYSTSRLLAPLSIAAVVAVAPGRRWWRCHLALAAGFAVAVAPYAWFVSTHPGALTGRFRDLSYVDAPGLTLWAKAATFAREYLSYLGPTFLLTGGDPNPRHATGLTGEAFVTVVALALVGLVTLARRGSFRRDPFWRLLLVLALAAPIPAALMTESRHSLRSLLLGLCLVLFSCAGLDRLARLADPADRRAALAAVAAALALEGVGRRPPLLHGLPGNLGRGLREPGLPARSGHRHRSAAGGDRAGERRHVAARPPRALPPHAAAGRYPHADRPPAAAAGPLHPLPGPALGARGDRPAEPRLGERGRRQAALLRRAGGFTLRRSGRT